jgi:hypothetical protein
MANPTQFTRSTGEDELDRFNQWMRSQPWYQEQRARMGSSVDDREQDDLTAALARAGIPLPKDFHIDEGGNLNQKSRAGKYAKIAAIGGGAALGGLGLLGMGPLGGMLGGIGGAAGGAGGVGGALASAAPLSEAVIPTTLGIGGGLGAAGAGAGAATAATTAATGGGGLGLKKLLGLGGLGMGLDLAGQYLSPGDDDTDNREGFQGKTAANGVSLDPGNVYGQGLGALQDLMPMMKQKAFNPTRLRPMESAGGDFEDARKLFQGLGF